MTKNQQVAIPRFGLAYFFSGPKATREPDASYRRAPQELLLVSAGNVREDCHVFEKYSTAETCTLNQRAGFCISLLPMGGPRSYRHFRVFFCREQALGIEHRGLLEKAPSLLPLSGGCFVFQLTPIEPIHFCPEFIFGAPRVVKHPLWLR